MATEGGCDDAMRQLVCVLCNTRMLTAAEKKERKKKRKFEWHGAKLHSCHTKPRINNEKCARLGRGGAAAVEEEKDETATGGKRNLMSDGTGETLPPV